jgi:hypothetical protein
MIKTCKQAADTLIHGKGTKSQQDESIQILTTNCFDQRTKPEYYKKVKKPIYGDCCTELERTQLAKGLTTSHGFPSRLADKTQLSQDQIRAALTDVSTLPYVSEVKPVGVRRPAKAAEQNLRASEFHHDREEYAELLHKYIQPSMDELTQKTMRAKIVRASEADKKTIDDHGATAMAFSHKEFLKNLIVVDKKFEAEARQQQLRVNQELLDELGDSTKTPEERAREALTTEEKEKAYWEAFDKLVDETVAARDTDETVAARDTDETVAARDASKPTDDYSTMELVTEQETRDAFKERYQLGHDDFDVGMLGDGTYRVSDNVTKKVYKVPPLPAQPGRTHRGGKRKTRKSHKRKGKTNKRRGKTNKRRGKTNKRRGKSHKAKCKRKTRKH